MKQKPRKKRRPQQRFEVLPGEGRRFSFSNLKQALLFYLFLFVALAVIAQLGYHWLGGQFLAWRLQVVAAEPGIFEQEVRVSGVVTRNEVVVSAPADGIILQLSPAGERVPASAELVKLGVVSQSDLQALRGDHGAGPDEDLFRQFINYWQQVFTDEQGGQAGDVNGTSGGVSFVEIIGIYNETPGYLSYYLDRGEDLAGPAYQMPDQDAEDREIVSVSEGDLVAKGQPILKIVDNWQWFYSLVLPLNPGRSLTALPTVEIEFDFAPGERVTAKKYHYEINESANSVRISYIIEKQVPGFEQARLEEASIFYGRLQGIIIPAEALLEKDQNPGVYLNQGGRVVFYPVSIIERQEEKLMVEGLAPYSLVITRPELVEEGRRLN